MGTDIHGWLQQRYGNTGDWENIAQVPKNRDYELFAALADVRNGNGFAGVYTGEPLRFIAEPRGLPEDLQAKIEEVENRAEADPDFDWPRAFDFGEHSQTWFTLAELLNWDGWDQPIIRGGVVERAEFEACQTEKRQPREWAGDTFGRNVIKTTTEAIADGTAPEGYTHVVMRWEAGKLSDNLGAFKVWLDYLRAAYGWLLERPDSYQQLRLVIGFDS